MNQGGLDDGWWEEMERLFASAWGPPAAALSERIAGDDTAMIDLVWHRRGERFLWLRTRGMSTRPMQVPPEAATVDRAELVTAIPGGWQFVAEDGSVDEANWWLGRAIKHVALFPQARQGWLGHGHTLRLSADGRTPIDPSTVFTDVLLHVPLPPPEPLFVWQGQRCGFLLPVFLSAAEAEAIRQDGLDAIKSFGPSFSLWIEPRRACSVTGRRPSR